MTRSSDPDVQLLAALADPVRLAIVRQLSADGEVCACSIQYSRGGRKARTAVPGRASGTGAWCRE